MKKNEIFTFTAPNGAEVQAVVVTIIKDNKDDEWYLCYAQNRLFHYRIITGLEPSISVWVDYAILPDYDKILQSYSNTIVTTEEDIQALVEMKNKILHG